PEAVAGAVDAVILEGIRVGSKGVVVPCQGHGAVERRAHQAGRFGEDGAVARPRAGRVGGAGDEGDHRDWQPGAHWNLRLWEAKGPVARVHGLCQKGGGKGNRTKGSPPSSPLPFSPFPPFPRPPSPPVRRG